MYEISANELKIKGVSALKNIDNEKNAIITIHDKQKYIVLPIEKYNKLEEFELVIALKDVKKDIINNNFQIGIEEHIARVLNV